MDVRKRNGRQTHHHEDRRPAGLAETKRRLEIAGPAECQATASVSIMTARSGIGGAPPHREEVHGVTRRDRALATSFSMTGGVSNVDIAGNNALQIKARGV